MKTERRLRNIAFMCIFLIILMTLSTASFEKLVHFYMYDEIDYNEWSPDLGRKFETDIATTFYHKFDFVNFNGAMRNILGQKEMNGVVKLNNGYLLTCCPYVSDDILQQNADSLIQLKKYLDKKGIAFIYAIPPYTSDKYDPQLPDGVEDYGNDNLDRFAKMLRKGGINPLDFRETMHEDGFTAYDMIYRTDHHWNTEAGFYAYLKLTEQLEKLLDCRTDPQIKSFSNYTITNYENWHLGSRGQRTGKYYAGSDDFHLMTPDFDTAITHGETRGTYESLIINMSALESRNDTSRYTYDTTLGNANSDYTNQLSFNDKKLLVMSDSFAKAVNPFLILSYAELRYLNTGLTKEYIEEYQPDAVIIFYYVSNAVSENIYHYELDENL